MNDWLCNVVLFDVQFAEPREANYEDVMGRRFDQTYYFLSKLFFILLTCVFIFKWID